MIPCLSGQLIADYGAVEGAAESTPVSFTVDAALLEEGTNVIAVEVHQDSASSPDMSFDLALSIPDGPHRRPVITALTPANGTINQPTAGGLSFTVTSSQPVSPGGVTLNLNGGGVSAGLVFTGSATNLTVSYAGLEPNRVYAAVATVSNCLGQAVASWSFDTRVPAPPCPQDVVQLALLWPTNGAEYHPYQTGLVYTVRSVHPVQPWEVSLRLNNTDVSTNLVFTGNPTNWAVSYTNLAPWTVYVGEVAVTRTVSPCGGGGGFVAAAAGIGSVVASLGPFPFDTRPPDLGPDEPCGVYFDVVEVKEIYFSLSDALKSITAAGSPFSVSAVVKNTVNSAEALAQGCATFTIAGVTITGNGGVQFSASGALITGLSVAQSVAGSGSSYNGYQTLITPSIAPCSNNLILTVPLAHFSGNIGLTITSLDDPGAGLWARKVAKGRYRFCRDIAIENASSQPIEVPIRLTGTVLGTAFLGDISRTFGEAELSVDGGRGPR